VFIEERLPVHANSLQKL